IRKLAHCPAGDESKFALVVAVADTAEGALASRAWNTPEALHGALPWRRGSLAGAPCVALPQPRYEQRPAVLEARRLEVRDERLVQFHGLHEFDVAEMALSANGFGRQPELLAKRPCEGFVRAVTGVQGHR